MEQFKVKTSHFEGPLDLLLDLIEKRKLFINDISLAKVADDYIEYVRSLEQFPLADSANFVLIASTLVLIKSKSLLPNLALSEEEEQSIGDLERRLKLYKRIKELSTHVRDRFGSHMIFPKSDSRMITPVFTPSKDTSLANLMSAIKRVLQELPKKELLPKAIVKKVLSLEDAIEGLTQRIKTSLQMSFRQFANVGKEEKVTIIVHFLAMLELVKQGVIMVKQEKDFDDITIQTEAIGTPQYGS